MGRREKELLLECLFEIDSSLLLLLLLLLLFMDCYTYTNSNVRSYVVGAEILIILSNLC